MARYLFAGLSEDLRVTEAEVTVSVYSSGDSHAAGTPREMPREAVLRCRLSRGRCSALRASLPDL